MAQSDGKIFIGDELLKLKGAIKRLYFALDYGCNAQKELRDLRLSIRSAEIACDSYKTDSLSIRCIEAMLRAKIAVARIVLQTSELRVASRY
jgi:hypothetical protein